MTRERTVIPSRVAEADSSGPLGARSLAQQLARQRRQAYARSHSPTLTRDINSITPTIIETTSLYSSPVTPTNAITIAFAFTTTTTTTISYGDSLLNCPKPPIHLTHRPGWSLANQSNRDW
ncbi:unnamed protein product [Schistocephalus solidus]|uniref:Uncharacterized protein n=1 Tax=Schistocephalus solidus TaxID=70667 RepID=A0A183TEP2_SCHSO|nr:unnamed protein product [Schistocephalus solidus]